MSLEGKTVLVTGATGGLGEQFVTQALTRGASRVYAAARSERTWEDERVVPLRLDVSDPDVGRALPSDGVDVLVNNAGTFGAKSLLQSDINEVQATFEANVFGPLRLVRALLPGFLRRGGGAVIDVHSVMSWLAVPGAYAPSKTALWGLTNALRLELRPEGVRVIGVHLGYADTAMTAHLTGVPKVAPADVVARVYDGYDAGVDEVIVDEVSARVRAALSTHTTGELTP